MADKQLKLEASLHNEIGKYWEEEEFQISDLNGNGIPSKLSGNIEDIKEKLDADIMTLNSYNAMRYVGPFRVEVTEKINQLSEVLDTIE